MDRVPMFATEGDRIRYEEERQRRLVAETVLRAALQSAYFAEYQHIQITYETLRVIADGFGVTQKGMYP